MGTLSAYWRNQDRDDAMTLLWQHATHNLYIGLSEVAHKRAIDHVCETLTGKDLYGSSTAGPDEPTDIDQVVAWFSAIRFGRLPSTVECRDQGNRIKCAAYWLESVATAYYDKASA